jgi:hypothetical protein
MSANLPEGILQISTNPRWFDVWGSPAESLVLHIFRLRQSLFEGKESVCRVVYDPV